MHDLIPKPICIIESPFAGDVEGNLKYARAAMHDSLMRGEAPYASHLLYTQEGVLDDSIPEERELGITSGFHFKRVADITAFYVDRGWSSGMLLAKEYCEVNGMPYEERSIE